MSPEIVRAEFRGRLPAYRYNNQPGEEQFVNLTWVRESNCSLHYRPCFGEFALLPSIELLLLDF